MTRRPSENISMASSNDAAGQSHGRDLQSLSIQLLLLLQGHLGVGGVGKKRNLSLEQLSSFLRHTESFPST